MSAPRRTGACAGADQPGKAVAADLTVLADSPPAVPDADLAQVPVRLTVVGARPAYRDPGV